MTIKAREYLIDNDGKRVQLVIDGVVVRGICHLLGKFVQINNKTQFHQLGGRATFGMAHIESDDVMTKEEFNRG